MCATDSEKIAQGIFFCEGEDRAAEYYNLAREIGAKHKIVNRRRSS